VGVVPKAFFNSFLVGYVKPCRFLASGDVVGAAQIGCCYQLGIFEKPFERQVL